MRALSLLLLLIIGLSSATSAEARRTGSRRWSGVVMLAEPSQLDSTTLDTGANASNLIGYYGQSRSIGADGTPAQSTVQPYQNLGANGTLFPALVEPAPGGTASAESGVASTLNQLRASAGAGRNWIGWTDGVSGTDCVGLRRGTSPFTNYLGQVSNSWAQRASVGGTVGLRAIPMVHGESDCDDPDPLGNPAYLACIEGLRQELETDARGIHGVQSPSGRRRIAMFHRQPSSWSAAALNSRWRCTVPEQIWSLTKGYYRNKHYLVGPSYDEDDGSPGDGGYATEVHDNATGYEYSACRTGEVLNDVLIDGISWRPLEPISAVASGSSIRLCLDVPCARRGTCGATQLVIDTTDVVCPANTTGTGTCLAGIEVDDTCPNPVHATAVAVDGATNCIDITMSGTVRAGCTTVSYARSAVPGSRAGDGTNILMQGSARGNIRDTDTTQCVSTLSAMPNWLIHFSSFAVTGGSAPPASVATQIDDVAPNWFCDFSGSNCPTAGAALNCTINGSSRALPYVAGTWSCAGATTGLAAGAIGTARVGAIMAPTPGSPPCWDESTGSTAFDLGTSDDVLGEFVGYWGQPGSGAITLARFEGDVTPAENRLEMALQTDGRATMTINTAGGNSAFNSAVNTISPRPQLGVLWMLGEKVGGDSNSLSQVGTLCYNGSCTASDASAAAGGATNQGTFSLSCNNTGASTSRNPFPVISHAWSTGQRAINRARGGMGVGQVAAANLAAYSAICPSPPCWEPYTDRFYFGPTTGEWASSPAFASADGSGFTVIVRHRTTATPATNQVLFGREPGMQCRTDFQASGNLRPRCYLALISPGDTGQSCWHTDDELVVNEWQTIGINVDEARAAGGGTVAEQNQRIMDYWARRPGDSYALLDDFDTCGGVLMDVGAAAAAFYLNHGPAGGADGAASQYRQTMFFDRALTDAEMRAVMAPNADPNQPLIDPLTGATVNVASSLVFWLPMDGRNSTLNGTAGLIKDWSNRTACGGARCDFTGSSADAVDIVYDPTGG